MKAVIGIGDMVKASAPCQSIVEGSINGACTRLYKSPRLRGGMGMLNQVTFPSGMERLRRKAIDAGNRINCDHAVWADARFTGQR